MLRTLITGFRLLTPAERVRWMGLVPLAVLGAALEALGAAAVFVLVKMLSAPEQAASLPVVSSIAPFLPWHDPGAVALSFTVLVAAFYVGKNILLAVVAYAQSKVATDSVAALSRRLLAGYLTVPFAFHFRRNSAELIRNALDATDTALRTAMGSAINVATEALVTAGIIGVLIALAPFATLSATAILLGMLAAVLAVTRRRFTQWGSAEHRLRLTLLQHLQQSFGALKELKVLGRERFFFDALSTHMGSLARTRHLHTTLARTPHLLIETVFVCGMLVVVALVILRGSPETDVVSLLGLYAYAGFRIIPSTNRILMNAANVRHGAAAIDSLSADVQLFDRLRAGAFPAGDAGRIAFSNRLVLDRVSYTYDGSDTPALRDVSLAIARGESIGIVGPTGGGKSTVADVILGLLQPSAGRVTVDGVDIADVLQPWRRLVGYVPQQVVLIDDSVRRNIALSVPDADIDEQQMWAAVRMAQLEEFVAALADGLDTVVGERGLRLSGGERQRVGIARALYHQPELLVFDEATSALDNRTEHALAQAIQALQGTKTLVIIAHRLTTVRGCDRLVFLSGGQVAGIGSFDALLQSNAEFRRMASIPAAGGAGS